MARNDIFWRPASESSKFLEQAILSTESAKIVAPRLAEAAYKAPLALALTNRSEAGRTVAITVSTNRSKQGLLSQAAPRETDRGTDIYEDLWFLWGASALGLFDLRGEIWSSLESYRDEGSGGWRRRQLEPEVRGNLELRTTALAGIVALALGESDVAEAAGAFVRRLAAQQDRMMSEGLVMLTDELGTVIRTAPSAEPERLFVLSGNQSNPLYYAASLALSLLCSLPDSDRSPSVPSASDAYWELYKSFGLEAFVGRYSGKFGWAAALYSSLGRHPEAAGDAYKIGRQLIAAQGPLRVRALSGGSLTERVQSIDQLAESIIWLRFIPDALERSVLFRSIART